MSSLIRKFLVGLSSQPDVPILALLSDFGTRDSFVGTMKGVIAGINPSARLIDISHDVTPHDVREGAFTLWSAYRYFPMGTIFLSIVDPGVGTDREILIAHTESYTFVAPDNGLLDLVLSDRGQATIFALRSNDPGGKWRRYALKEISQTFHGRDIFAPVAAHLSLGVMPTQIGDPRAKAVPQIAFCDPSSGKDMPRLLHIDTFGNLVTNIRGSRSLKDSFVLTLGKRRIACWVSAYEQAPKGVPCLIIGSSGLVEIVVRRGSAAVALGATTDSRLELILR
jgi:S-adenosylmethionine hydrolase